MKIYTRYKWINPLEPLPSKMVYYNEHVMHVVEVFLADA